MKPNPNAKKNDPPRPRYETALCQGAYEAIRGCESIVTVYFWKRTNGQMRQMHCLYRDEAAERTRLGYNPIEKSLLPVLDVDKGEMRMISLDRVRRIVYEGERIWPKEDLPSTLEEANQEMEDLFGY